MSVERACGFWVANVRSPEALDSYVSLAGLKDGLKLVPTAYGQQAVGRDWN
jgi:hypothetical protein